MPSVLTKKGWMVFDTQKEADAFKANMEAREITINAGMQEEDTQESEQALRHQDNTQKEVDAPIKDEGFMRSLKRKSGRRN